MVITNGTTEKNETMIKSTSESSQSTTEASSIVSSSGKMTSLDSTTTEGSSIGSSSGKITTMDSKGTFISEHPSTTPSAPGSSTKFEMTETMGRTTKKDDTVMTTTFQASGKNVFLFFTISAAYLSVNPLYC